MTIPPNDFERVNRRNKAKKLFRGLVKVALEHGHNLRDEKAARAFAALLRTEQFPAAWQRAAQVAECNAPSDETKRLVIDRLESVGW